MSDFKNIINFFRLSRRSEEADTALIPEAEVLLQHIDEDIEYKVDKKIFESNFNLFKRIFQSIENSIDNKIYKWENGTERKYFIKSTFNKFRNLLDDVIQPIPTNNVDEIEIDFNSSDYIYDTNKNRISIFVHLLNGVTIFPDNIHYSPDNECFKNIENGRIEYNYKDHVTLFGKVLKTIYENNLSYIWHNPEKQVLVTKFDVSGRVNIIPFLDVDYKHDNYILKYLYYDKEYKPKFSDGRTLDAAVILNFSSIGGILSYLNDTLFSQGFSMNMDERNTSNRNFFRQQFLEQIIEETEKNITKKNSTSREYEDAMKTLFYLPDSVYQTFSDDFLWMLLELAINRDSLTNKTNLAEENIFVKLFRIILEKPEREVKLMNWLLSPHKDGNKTINKFEFIYNRIHGDNFIEFVKLINTAWKKSRFILPDTEKNPEFLTTDGPVFLPYSSQKTLGFYFSNVSLSFETHQQKGRLLNTELETKKEIDKLEPKTGSWYKDNVKIIDKYWYHPFYPIYLKEIENQETNLKLNSVVPAFMLKANEDKKFWSNVVTTAEYAADILTTLSGVGNIAKFRHLAKLGKAGGIIAKVKLAAGVVEVASGTVNTLIKLTNSTDSKLGKAISEYLFWLEMLSLSGEITVGIRNGLKKSAKEIVENPETKSQFQKELDDLVESGKIKRSEADEIIEHLDEVAEVDFMAKPNEIGKLGGKVLNASQIRQLRGELKKKGVLLIMEEDLKIKNIVNQYKKVMLNGMEFENPQDLFFYMKREGFAGAFDAKTKQLILSEKSTELVAFHEKAHLQHFEEFGEAYHSLMPWQKETYVFEKIWSQKHLWTKEELRISLGYLNRVRKEAGINPLKIKL